MTDAPPPQQAIFGRNLAAIIDTRRQCKACAAHLCRAPDESRILLAKATVLPDDKTATAL